MLKTAADTLYKIWEHVSLQLETCERDNEAYELRRGFFILPDEILSTVLEYAALQGPWGEAHDNDKRDNEKENIVIPSNRPLNSPMFASGFEISSSIPRDSGSAFSMEWANPTWSQRVSLAADGATEK